MTGDNQNEHAMFQETFYTAPNEHIKLPDSEFFDWQCISFVRWNGTSLDLIVRNNDEMMALINIVQQYLYRPGKQLRLKFWQSLRFKIIVGYEAW